MENSISFFSYFKKHFKKHRGRNKYVLSRGLYEVSGKSGVYTRKIGLDRDTNKELLLKHIRENGENGTPFR